MAPAPAPVIVVACQKGGIGRTALAVNLAAMLALSGRRTLLVDLDAKGDATASLGLARPSKGKSLARMSEPWSFLKDKLSARVPPALDVWPGGPALNALKTELAGLERPSDDLLLAGLEHARRQYRAVVIDAPPDLGPLHNNALRCADVLLVPISSETFLERAMGETIAAALRVRPDILILGVRVECRDLGEAGLEDERPAREGPLGVELLEVAICYDPPTFQRAAAEGLPVFEAAPASRAARCFIELAREVVEKVLSPVES